RARSPIFFYWLDGLLAVWGLGVVALVVTSREDPRLLGAAGATHRLQWGAALALVWVILAIPSAIAAALVLDWVDLGLGALLAEVFATTSAWVSLAIAVVVHAGQVAGELRWRPDRTLAATGEARANFFIHRTLVLGILAGWAGGGSARPWALSVYVLAVAALFTYTQLHPERYLHLIGFRKLAGRDQAGSGRGRKSARRAGGAGAAEAGKEVSGRPR
ncbi:MAG: hypothetical protein ACOY3Y_20520, partial [Acidobacteriota bacterium]